MCRETRSVLDEISDSPHINNNDMIIDIIVGSLSTTHDYLSSN